MFSDPELNRAPEPETGQRPRPMAPAHEWICDNGETLAVKADPQDPEEPDFEPPDWAIVHQCFAVSAELLRVVGERDEARLQHDCSEASLAMAVARLGGVVEGRPTERINYLQRIDELVRIEAEQERLAEDRERFRAVSERLAFELKGVTEERDRYKALAGQQHSLLIKIAQRGCEGEDPETLCPEALPGADLDEWCAPCAANSGAYDADGQRAAEEWRALVAFRELSLDLARTLNCLPSTFPDANGHVLDLARKLMAEPEGAQP